MEETTTTVEKEPEVKVEQGRDQLVHLKGLAYDKYCEAWNAMEQMKETTYETLRSAWEQAWVSYASVVQQLRDIGHAAIETTTKEYETAKNNLRDRTADLQNWIVEHGHKLKEDSSDIQIETARKLHEARQDAYQRFLHANDALRNMFTSSQEIANEGVRSAEERVKKTTLHLDRHMDMAGEEPTEEFLKTKVELEDAKRIAERELEDAKSHLESLAGKASTWSEEVVKVLSDQSEFLSHRLSQMRHQIVDVAAHSKEKVEETTEAAGKLMSDKWQLIYNLIKEDSAYALEKLSLMKDSIGESFEGALMAAGITETLETPPPSPSPKEKTEDETPIGPINVPMA